MRDDGRCYRLEGCYRASDSVVGATAGAPYLCRSSSHPGEAYLSYTPHISADFLRYIEHHRVESREPRLPRGRGVRRGTPARTDHARESYAVYERTNSS